MNDRRLFRGNVNPLKRRLFIPSVSLSEVVMFIKGGV